MIFEEKTYTEDELRALFKAIHERKINRISIHEGDGIISFDIASVIRGKNCKYRDSTKTCCYDQPRGLWDTERMFVNMYCEDDFFCGYAEPKDDKQK